MAKPFARSAFTRGLVPPPPLLACLHDFAHVPRWSNLEDVAIGQRRMLANELYSMIHVPRLKHENATELFLGFRVWTVGGCHFAVLPVNGQRGFRRLERFSTSPLPVGAKMIVVIKACVEHGVLFGLSHAVEFAFVVVPETDVFHCSSPHSGLAEPAAERSAGSFIESPGRVSRGRGGPVCSLASDGFLIRSREEKKLAHLAHRIAGDGTLAGPRECLIQVCAFQYPESAHVLLGLGVGSVGNEHLAVSLLPHRLRIGGRGNAAG